VSLSSENNKMDKSEISPPLPVPKCVILYGDGLLSTSDIEDSKSPNIHKLVNDGCVGPLMLRKANHSDDSESRMYREIFQLLGLYDALYNKGGEKMFTYQDNSIQMQEGAAIPQFSTMYGGMKTQFLTTSQHLYTISTKLGFYGCSHIQELQSSSIVGSIFTALQAKVDSVFVHIQAADETTSKLQIFDDIISQLRTKDEDLFIILVAGFGDKTDVDVGFSTTKPNEKLQHILPTQSYTVKDGIILHNIRETSPLFAVYYQRNYTRRDATRQFLVQEFAKAHGNGKMLVDAFVREVGFKVGKLPKYGA